MSQKTRTNLKSLFEDGDTLEEDSFTDLIDSCVNLVDTTAQSFASNIQVPNLAANTVSADTVYGTNIFASKVFHNNPYIEMYSEGTAAVATLSAGGSLINQATSAANAVQFSQTTGLITYTGTVTARFSIMAQANVDSATDHNGFAILYKNATSIPRSQCRYDLSAGVTRAFQSQAVVELATNDTVSVKLGNHTGVSAAVNVKNFSLIASPVSLG